MNRAKETPHTLGTLADLGVLGHELSVATHIMRAAGKRVAKRCAVCNRRQIPMISGSPLPCRQTGAIPFPPSLDVAGSTCDPCWAKYLIESHSPTRYAIPLWARFALFFEEGADGKAGSITGDPLRDPGRWVRDFKDVFLAMRAWST